MMARPLLLLDVDGVLAIRPVTPDTSILRRRTVTVWQGVRVRRSRRVGLGAMICFLMFGSEGRREEKGGFGLVFDCMWNMIIWKRWSISE